MRKLLAYDPELQRFADTAVVSSCVKIKVERHLTCRTQMKSCTIVMVRMNEPIRSLSNDVFERLSIFIISNIFLHPLGRPILKLFGTFSMEFKAILGNILG